MNGDLKVFFFLQQKQDNWKYQETIDKAIRNIESNIQSINNPYAQGIAAYALQIANHPKKDELLDNFVSKSITRGVYLILKKNIHWNSGNIH